MYASQVWIMNKWDFETIKVEDKTFLRAINGKTIF